MWSLVIAKDLMTPFKKSGLMATDVTHEISRHDPGARWRRKPGRGAREGLPRPPYNFKAFEEYLSE